MRRLPAAALLVLLASVPAGAGEYAVGSIHVSQPWAPPSIGMARTLAGYLAIRNNGPAPDTLVDVAAGFASVTLHRSEMAGDVATMRTIDAVEIAPGQTVTFAPGGLHVMFMGLDGRRFGPGDSFAAILTFARAGALPVTFTVKNHSGAAGTHSGHETTPATD